MDWWTWLLLAEGGAFLFSLWFARWDQRKSDLREYEESGKLPKKSPGSVLGWAFAITLFFPLFVAGALVVGAHKVINSDIAAALLQPAKKEVEGIETRAEESVKDMENLFQMALDKPEDARAPYFEIIEETEKLVRKEVPQDRLEAVGFRSLKVMKKFPFECDSCHGHTATLAEHYRNCSRCGDSFPSCDGPIASEHMNSECPRKLESGKPKEKTEKQEPAKVFVNSLPDIEKPKSSSSSDWFSDEEMKFLIDELGMTRQEINRQARDPHTRRAVKRALKEYI
ncbi:hypothetical protein SEA_KEELAN_20 [Gordonia phage Keelan]|nr:hypothetical protein SEA_KEELAN_20 [Gordonia phage Keelan]